MLFPNIFIDFRFLFLRSQTCIQLPELEARYLELFEKLKATMLFLICVSEFNTSLSVSTLEKGTSVALNRTHRSSSCPRLKPTSRNIGEGETVGNLKAREVKRREIPLLGTGHPVYMPAYISPQAWK